MGMFPNGAESARAAECAAEQEKFWEMHDLLYEHQHDLADADLVNYALKLGLEVYRFESDLSGEVFAKRVSDDFRGGVRSGVNGTPTFFINGVRYDGPYDYDSLKSALESAV
jgi:protein-disulfide isomerase